jgi:hypothetical protein
MRYIPNFGDEEIRKRINGLNQVKGALGQNQGDVFALFQKFLAWRGSKKTGTP